MDTVNRDVSERMIRPAGMIPNYYTQDRIVELLVRAVAEGNPYEKRYLSSVITGEARAQAICCLEQEAEARDIKAVRSLALLIQEEDRGRAIELYRWAAEAGDAEAMFDLAEMAEGDDRDRALSLLEQAAESGNYLAMNNLAILLESEDCNRARELWEIAAAAGQPDALNCLALSLQSEDRERAIELYERAVAGGDTLAKWSLASLIVDEDRGRAVELLEQAAEQDDSVALNWLASLLEGESRSRAIELYARAASLGNDAAMQNLAELMVDEDRELAIRLHERAIALGSTPAMVTLAALLVSEDRNRAIGLFEQAATRGSSGAMDWLAYLVVDDDRQRALELLERAVALGNTNAMVRLASLIAGEDRARAEELLEQAASLGDGVAKSRLAQLQEDSPSPTEEPAAERFHGLVVRSGLKRCPKCGKPAVAKSLFNDDDYCFPRHGGCGTLFPNLCITADGLARGVALDPYSDGTGHSFFGELVNRLKYHPLSDAQKLAIVDQAVAEIGKRAVVEELTRGANNLLVVPAPSSKNRTVQHVYEIAERVAGSKYLYLEALAKTTSTESKTMERGGEYDEGDFRCDYDLEGYSVLMIDDTYGEGATLKACIEVLRDSGAGAIYFMSLCRNTRGGIKHSGDHTDTDYDDI